MIGGLWSRLVYLYFPTNVYNNAFNSDRSSLSILRLIVLLLIDLQTFKSHIQELTIMTFLLMIWFIIVLLVMLFFYPQLVNYKFESMVCIQNTKNLHLLLAIIISTQLKHKFNLTVQYKNKLSRNLKISVQTKQCDWRATYCEYLNHYLCIQRPTIGKCNSWCNFLCY